jgi:hypothetical protein
VTYPANIETTGLPPTSEQTPEDGGSVIQRGAEVSKQQAGDVLDEAKRQTGDLLERARTEATQQATVQRDRSVQSLRTLGDELGEMADRSSQQGTGAELVRQASDRARQLAHFLDEREPGELLDEVRGYARRRPGTFLLGAVAAGVLAGRLTRASVDSQRDTGPMISGDGHR